jgi:oligoendopeptidase F
MTRKAIPARKDIPDEHKWDLTALFQSDQDWEKWFVEVENQISAYAGFKGRLKETVEVFRAALDFHLALTRKIERIQTYARLKSDEDKSNPFYLGLYQRAVGLNTRAGEASSFLIPEIQAVAADQMESYLADASMAIYRFYLEKILRYRPHTRSESVERVLAMSREMADTAIEVFGQLDNVDLNFGSLEDQNGSKIELSHGNFSTFLINPDRAVRQRAFFQYYRAYENHKHTLAATLAHGLKKDLFYARVRHFDSCRAAALFADNIPEAVYDNLLQTVKSNLAPFFKYMNFRKQTLALSELHFYDSYVPIVGGVEFHIPYEEAVDLSIEAMRPLGENYLKIMRDGLRGGWVDRYENRGKRSGAYASGCYDAPPYILLNYEKNNIDSVYTLVHEAGHAMHSYFADRHQPYVDHEYAIFVAEVASTFNENLLTRYLLALYKNDPARTAYILNREIDNLRATLIRQTMFAEFEKITHSRVESNAPLTLEVITGIYRNLLQVYFGDTLVLDPQLDLECLRIPHFYYGFYVYKYATGIAAAVALADKVVNQGESAKNAYLDFLKLGGSKFPLEQLIAAGVDMRSAEPVRRALNYFADLVERLQATCRNL